MGDRTEGSRYPPKTVFKKSELKKKYTTYLFQNLEGRQDGHLPPTPDF
jgi:hypothetical protein